MSNDTLLCSLDIDDYTAKLLLLENNSIVVVVNDEVVHESNSITYENLKEVDMLDSYLQLVVECYISSDRNNKEFDSLVEKLGW